MILTGEAKQISDRGGFGRAALHGEPRDLLGQRIEDLGIDPASEDADPGDLFAGQTLHVLKGGFIAEGQGMIDGVEEFAAGGGK